MRGSIPPGLVLALSLAGGCGSDAVDNDTDGGPDPEQLERGRYLVEVVALCSECHTPVDAEGKPDETLALSGRECFVDVDPVTDGEGCLHSANLTNHETGLANRSEAEIRELFQTGDRPLGRPLHPIMPYWSYANMTDEDADAVVAYLRTVPGIDHQVPPNEAPFNMVEEILPPLNLDMVPSPATDDPNYESAMRGRYLAAAAGACLECHTPDGSGTEARDLTRAFHGGRYFPAAGLGLPVPPYPALIVSANITPDPTGIEGYTAEKIVGILKNGSAEACRPMPSGPDGPLGGLTDDDALDIANYLLSLPPGQNDVGAGCTPP